MKGEQGDFWAVVTNDKILGTVHSLPDIKQGEMKIFSQHIPFRLFLFIIRISIIW